MPLVPLFEPNRETRPKMPTVARTRRCVVGQTSQRLSLRARVGASRGTAPLLGRENRFTVSRYWLVAALLAVTFLAANPTRALANERAT